MRSALYLLMLLYAGVGGASDDPMETSPCPGLVSSYNDETFERLLVVTDADFASVEDCEQLGAFYFNRPLSPNYSLNYSRLDAIVDEIWQPVNEEAPFLLMEAILSWLKRHGFEEYAKSVRDFMNEYMPEDESVRLFFTVIIWFIVVGTVILVVYEFYRAGMLRLPRLRSGPDDVETTGSQPALQWEAILALPLREQIGALLQYSIEQLVARRLLPSSRSYTNRELVSYLELSDMQKAGLLREQIDITEPVVYGDEHVTEEQVIACRVTTRGLSDA